MRRVVVINHVTLDGVMQGPGRPDEDTRGGFEHGGWAAGNNDDVIGAAVGERMAESGGLLLGVCATVTTSTRAQGGISWPKTPPRQR
jgi:hypothetical protein